MTPNGATVELGEPSFGGVWYWHPHHGAWGWWADLEALLPLTDLAAELLELARAQQPPFDAYSDDVRRQAAELVRSGV